MINEEIPPVILPASFIEENNLPNVANAPIVAGNPNPISSILDITFPITSDTELNPSKNPLIVSLWNTVDAIPVHVAFSCANFPETESMYFAFSCIAEPIWSFLPN